MKSLSLRYKNIFQHPIVILLIGLLPCFASGFHFYRSKQQQQNLELKIRSLNRKNFDQKQRAEREKKLVERLKGADPDYVPKTLETLTFLDGESKRIEAFLLDHPEEKNQMRRLQFLKGEANRLRFREKNFQRVGKFQEVDVILQHPVEMGKEDLTFLLSKLEHTRIGSYTPDPNAPDFLIEQFEMIRKTLSKDEEVYLVKFNCIKREYVHE